MNVRKKRALISSGVVIVVTGVKYILSFVARPILIYYIGTQILGLYTTVTAMIAIISLFESQISLAISAAIYKPLGQNNYSKLASLAKYYRKIYRLLGAGAMVLSLIIVPFVFFADPNASQSADYNDLPNTAVLGGAFFLISLIGMLAYYFCFVGLRPIMSADQRQYIIEGYSGIGALIALVLQLIIVFTVPSPIICAILYALSISATSICVDLALYLKARRLYPEVGEISVINELTAEEKHIVTKNTIGGSSTVIRGFIPYALNPLAISITSGFSMVVHFMNYQMIIEAFTGLIERSLATLTAGVGNAKEEWNRVKALENYQNLQFITFIIAIIGGNCLIACYQPFIQLWVGENMLLNGLIPIFMTLQFILTIFALIPLNTYINAYGLMQKIIRINIIGSVIYLLILLLFSFIFNLGIVGITAIPVIVNVLIYIPFCLKVLWRNVFTQGLGAFLRKFLNYSLQIVLSLVFCKYLTELLIFPALNSSILQFIFGGLSGVITGIIVIMLNFKRSEFRYLMSHLPYFRNKYTLEFE